MSGRVGVVGGLGIVKPTPANLVCFRLYLVFLVHCRRLLSINAAIHDATLSLEKNIFAVSTFHKFMIHHTHKSLVSHKLQRG